MPLRKSDLPGLTEVSVIVNAAEVSRALRRFDADLQKETRREMAAVARSGRDEIRGDWPVGPSAGGHSFRAVTSGTRGLIPVLKLRRDYRPYVGWLVFGGTRRRNYGTGVRVDRHARQAPASGYWFYPGIARTRPQATERARKALTAAIRKAGLD